MKTFLSILLVASALAVALTSRAEDARTRTQPPRAGEAQSVAHNFDVQKLAEGIYAVIRRDPPGLMVDANSVFIINEEDVIVVDSSGAPSTTKAVLAALRRLTDKPVRYVVNTHWHDDHIIGNTAYREAFAGVEFIAHAEMREYLPGRGATNRKGFLEGAPRALSAIKDALSKNKNLSGTELSAEERTSYESDVRLVEHVLGEAAGTQLTLPTVTLRERLTLHRGGGRVVEILHLGRGHTAGDVVVHLPREGVVVTGDLVVWPVPLVGGDQSHVSDWAATLSKLRALGAKVIVPGHGPVLRDDSYLKLLEDLFASVKRQADALKARGETLEQARKSVNLEEFRKAFAGDSTVRQFLFDTYVKGPSVAAAFREASAKR
ncbi:MAG TPA: MBL fold metallo-hydrolase [Pyrinomonadaceae bacterium]|nr:MBL fold metallo-hydrolase [Pyrinomonadaceae bacterium]